MALREFTWRPKRENEGSFTFRTLTAQFGDGYAQRAGDGINLRKGSWALEFVGTSTKILAIKVFLDEHEGYKSFLYRPTLLPRAVSCVATQGYKLVEVGPGISRLSVTIEENNRLVQ